MLMKVYLLSYKQFNFELDEEKLKEKHGLFLHFVLSSRFI